MVGYIDVVVLRTPVLEGLNIIRDIVEYIDVEGLHSHVLGRLRILLGIL
jgi:hypothetical protein